MKKDKNPNEINDINEAMQLGINLGEIEDAAIPVTPDELDPELLHRRWAADGVTAMKKLKNDIREQGDLDSIRHVLEEEDVMVNLAWAWMLREKQIQQVMFDITALDSQMGKPVRRLLHKIKKQAITIRASKRSETVQAKLMARPPKYKPDPQTWDMLDRKPIKEKGEIVSYGMPYPTMYNAHLVFKHDPRWVGRIRFSNLDHCTHIDEQPIEDVEEARLGSWLTRVYGFEIADKKLASRIHLVASDNPYHPVQDYFMNLKRWDGVPRLKNLFKTYIPADDCDDVNWNEFSLGNAMQDEVVDYGDLGFGSNEIPCIQQIYGIRYFIACVARAMSPGCKQDVVLCLIGRQGQNKSQAIEVIATDSRWWSESTFDLTKKDAYINVLGKWIIEIKEGETLHRSGYNATKAFLSQRTARFRRPFDRNARDNNLSHCFWLSTNEDSLPFLNDASGSRRYWVLRVESAKIALLRRDIDKLWAEAAHYYWRGEQWWLEPHEEEKREIVNEIYRTRDSWEAQIASFISVGIARASQKKRRFEFYVAQILTESLRIPPRLQNTADVTRIGHILKRLGCIKEGRKKYGRSYRHTWIVPMHLEKDFLTDSKR